MWIDYSWYWYCKDEPQEEGVVAENVVPHVEHAGTCSQNIDKHTLHTYPSDVGLLWQKQEARKSTPVGRGSCKKALDPGSTLYAVCMCDS